MLSLVGWNEINIHNIVYLFLLVCDLEKLLFCHWRDRVYFVNAYPYSMLDWVSLEYLDEFLCPHKNCTVYVMHNFNIAFTSVCPLLLSDSKRKTKNHHLLAFSKVADCIFFNMLFFVTHSPLLLNILNSCIVEFQCLGRNHVLTIFIPTTHSYNQLSLFNQWNQQEITALYVKTSSHLFSLMFLCFLYKVFNVGYYSGPEWNCIHQLN